MSGPQRIQLRRAKGWRMPANTVKVDRSTRWGNAWRVGSNMRCEGCPPEEGQPPGWRTCRTAADCVAAYRQSVDWDPTATSVLPTAEGYLEVSGGYDDAIHVNRRSIRRFLAGKNLACWCALDAPCHADVLLELANHPETQP